MLSVLTMCLAIYSNPNDTRPIVVSCETYDMPIVLNPYDCAGELVTDGDDLAVCEVTLHAEVTP